MHTPHLLILGLLSGGIGTFTTAAPSAPNTIEACVIQMIIDGANTISNDLSTAITNVNSTADTLVGLVNTLVQNSTDSINTVSSQLAQVNQQLSDNTLDLVQTFALVQQNGMLINQMMDEMNDNRQAIAGALDSISADLSENNTEVLSAIEAVDEHVGVLCAVVEAGGCYLYAQMNALASQLDACCTELSEDDAKIFSAVEAVDTHVAATCNTVKISSVVLNKKINCLSSQLAECCTELSENDAKIFSAVERIETTLSSVFCAASRDQKTPIVESPASRHQVKFISNKHATRTGGIVITQPGLYMLTESLTIDSEQGISIQAENVTLDLNTFTITASADDVAPLTIMQSDTICVKNGTFVGGQGITVTESTGIFFENLIITYPTNAGIQVSSVQGITINNCAVRAGMQAGISADTNSAEISVRNSTISDCQGNGFDLQAQGLLLQDVIAQYNGGNGVSISNSANAHLQRLVVDNNSNNGIFIDSSVERVQVESCRVMGNGAIGCLDSGATLATWMNNLASGNQQDDYKNIKAVLVGKATSFWHNVYGN